MIEIYGSFMVLEFRSLDLGSWNLFGTRSRMEMEVWNNLVESWSRARINSNQFEFNST
jgi:hypothetical protein